MLTRTIATKGHIKEVAKEAKIEVNNKLIVNNKDITNQLQADKIIKTLSSEGKLTHEQINLVKAVLNNKEWDDKTTTLSGLGSLIVAVVVTVLTAGAGTAIVGAAGTAAAGTTAAAVQAAVVQSVVTGVTTQLTTAAITGNSFKLDGKALLKGAVSAGVMSYAGSMIDSSLGLEGVDVADMSYTEQFQQGVSHSVVKSAVDSAVYGTDFEDNLVFNATTNIGNKAFEYVGHELYAENSQYKDILPPKAITHGIIGGAVAELQGGDFKDGAVSTVTAHLTAEAMINTYMDDVVDGTMSQQELEKRTKLVSSLTSGMVTKIVNPDISDNDLLNSNQIAQNNVDNNSLKLITTAIKVARKLKKIEGKITKEKLKKIGLDEIADIADDASTIFDPNASLAEKAMAVADLTLGTEFNNRKGKIFTKETIKAPSGKTYSFYGQKVDLDLVIDGTFNKKTGKPYTNREWMKKGNNPYVVDKNGKTVTTQQHHSKQNADGPIFEIQTKTHQNPTNQQVLHPYGQAGIGKNPNNPVDHKEWNKDRTFINKERLKKLEE